MNGLQSYAYLWDGSDPNWVLFYLNPDDPEKLARFAILNVQSRQSLIIENDDVFEEVISRMHHANVRIIRSLPEKNSKD